MMKAPTDGPFCIPLDTQTVCCLILNLHHYAARYMPACSLLSITQSSEGTEHPFGCYSPYLRAIADL
jgi:hypothetical protein